MSSRSAAQLRLAFVLLAVLFGWLESPGAVQAAELSWSAPADCGSAAELSAQVESLIHAPLSAVVDLDFEVRIQAAAHGGYALWLGTRSHTGGAVRVRELSGAECRDVVEAAAVAIALAITGENPAPAQPAAVSGETSVVTPASTPPPPPSAAELAAPVRFAAAASAVVDAGVLPSVAPGVAVELGLRWKLLHAIAQSAFFPVQTHRIGDGSRGGEFGLGLGALLACAERPFASFAALGCGGFELGALSAKGVGVTSTHPRTRALPSLRAELGGSWQVSADIDIFARVGATFPLRRDTFVLDQGDVHTPGTWSLRAGLGLEFFL